MSLSKPKMVTSPLQAYSSLFYQEFFESSSMSKYDMWFGTNPDVSGLRIYGCSTFAHFPKETRKAPDDQSEECIVIWKHSQAIDQENEKAHYCKTCQTCRNLTGIRSFEEQG
jgi:hypothetical protein